MKVNDLNKPELFGLAGLCFFAGLWITMASLPNPYVYPPAVGLGVFIGAISFFLIGHAMFANESKTEPSW